MRRSKINVTERKEGKGRKGRRKKRERKQGVKGIEEGRYMYRIAGNFHEHKFL